MEEMNKKVNKDMCDCAADNAFHLRPGMTRRLTIMIFLVIVAFWFGMELGEIKGYIGASHNNASMHPRATMIYQMSDKEARNMAPATPVESQTPAAPVTDSAN